MVNYVHDMVATQCKIYSYCTRANFHVPKRICTCGPWSNIYVQTLANIIIIQLKFT